MLRKVSTGSLFFLLIVLSSFSFAQNFNDPYIPDVDPNIDMYLGSWKESMPRHTHGSLVERDILTRGEDPMNPKAKGAVLSYVNSFSFATLDAHASTTPTVLKGEQEIFYIDSGTGIIKAGGKTADLYIGIAILMPADLEFTMTNTGDEPLTMYLINEPVPEGFKPRKDMLVKDVNTLPIAGSNWHWTMIGKTPFTKDDGLGTVETVHIIAFDPMTMGHPHIFFPGCEEVWTAIKGTGDAWIGKQLRKQPPGTAYMLPPDGKITHSNINATNEQILMLYFIVYNKNIVMDENAFSKLPRPFDGAPYTPDVDPNIDMYTGNWKESMPGHTHGSLIERDILTRGDPVNPASKGAVLKYANRFTYASLYKHTSTIPTTLKDEQEIFYILSGKGIIKAGDKTANLYEGIAVLMPSNLEFTMKNTGDETLTMYLINEPVPEGFIPNKEMLVKDESAQPVFTEGHWSHIVRNLFNARDGLGTIHSILTVAFDPMTIGHPHTYFTDSEEVWTQIRGSSIAWIGKQIRWQHPGTGYLVPPDGKIAHSNINQSHEQIKFFYFLRSGDPDYPK